MRKRCKNIYMKCFFFLERIFLFLFTSFKSFNKYANSSQIVPKRKPQGTYTSITFAPFSIYN